MLRRHPTIFIGGGGHRVMVMLAAAAPLFAGNPLAMDPMHRLRPPSGALVRHRQSRPRRVCAHVYGARISLLVGLSVAVGGLAGGLVIGLSADSTGGSMPW